MTTPDNVLDECIYTIKLATDEKDKEMQLLLANFLSLGQVESKLEGKDSELYRML
jgi:hypothetical protein